MSRRASGAGLWRRVSGPVSVAAGAGTALVAGCVGAGVRSGVAVWLPPPSARQPHQARAFVIPGRTATISRRRSIALGGGLFGRWCDGPVRAHGRSRQRTAACLRGGTTQASRRRREAHIRRDGPSDGPVEHRVVGSIRRRQATPMGHGRRVRTRLPRRAEQMARALGTGRRRSGRRAGKRHRSPGDTFHSRIAGHDQGRKTAGHKQGRRLAHCSWGCGSPRHSQVCAYPRCSWGCGAL